jgi:hypothetical protein
VRREAARVRQSKIAAAAAVEQDGGS